MTTTLPVSLLALLAGCGGAPPPVAPSRGSAPAVQPSTSAARPPARSADAGSPPARELPHDAGAPTTETVASAPPPTPPVLPGTGRFWVRRPDTWSGGVSRTRVGDPTEVEVHGRTGCVSIELSEERGRRRSLRWSRIALDLDVSGPPRQFAHVTLSTLAGDLPREPPVEVAGVCFPEWVVEPAAATAPFWQTSAGPLFRSAEACHASPDTYVRRCRGAVCEDEDPAAAPFQLGTCEAVITELQARAARIRGSSHAEIVRTLVRLEGIAARGGHLWQYVAETQRCEDVVVRPTRQGTHLRMRYAARDGARFEDEGVYEFMPVFRFAVVRSHGSRVLGPNGRSLGTSGTGRVGLYLGARVILLGGRWLFTRRGDCTAAALDPNAVVSRAP